MRKLLMMCTLVLLGGSAALAQDAASITHGPISGEVSDTAVTLWARGDGAGALTFQVATDADFSGEVIEMTVDVDEDSDFTGEAQLENLTPATQYFYRVSEGGGEAKSGQFKTAPAADDGAAFDFVFGACLGGQGYCRDPQTGWTIFDKMLAESPDFFLLTGDGIYADNACPTDKNQNVAGQESTATELQGYYSRYRYHLEDEHYAAFLAQTPVYANWDDHEILDNYGPETARINPQLVADGRQAFFDYWPVTGTEDQPFKLYRETHYGAHADFFMLDTRSYRDPEVNWDTNPVTGVPKTMLGVDQLEWLKQSLLDSDATWKFIMSGIPLGYPTGFPQPQVDGRDGWADAGNASGYETELMRILYFIEAHDIKNVIFITGDAHWPFALSFDPDVDGTPNFYEFSSSPLSALTLPPVPIDQTFNPTVLYEEGAFNGGLYNFGAIAVAENGDLTLRILDKEGAEHYSLTISPQ